MASLAGRYREASFSCGGELPDHLPVMLRYMGCCGDAEAARELATEAVLPALESMLRLSPKGYEPLLLALKTALQGGTWK